MPLAPAQREEAVAGLLLKLRARDVIPPEEEQALHEAVVEIREHPAARQIVRANTELSESTLLIEGLVCRYKDLKDGQRQISEVHFGGDFVDLHGFPLKKIEHNVGTMTPVRVAIVPHDSLRRITEDHPHLARMLWFSTLVDAAIHREKILSIGRRTALAAIGHLLCEFYLRLEVVGLAAGHRYALPLTQNDLADALGLTSVHVNRMLKQLRDEDLLSFRGGEVVIHDWERLTRAVEFDPAYLYFERRPR
jgi:CRP-like cAMP-binding protein